MNANGNGADTLDVGDGDEGVDPAILAALPKDCKVLSTARHGNSFWASTGRIDVQETCGTCQQYFVKILPGDIARSMVLSEFESMRTIHNVAPEFAPRPVAWGTFQSRPERHFFLCKFRDFDDTMPDPNDFAARLSKMHQESQSPVGKFGFHLTTYAGNLPQMVEWEASWETFFARSLRYALDLEIKAKGFDPSLDNLLPPLFNKVIPRLLRPLETEGRSIKPSLVHGDLWYANAGVDKHSGGSIVFDACCFYAHNEYEFGQWRPACNKFDDEYLKAYHKLVAKSDPQEDYDGRVDLYKL